MYQPNKSEILPASSKYATSIKWIKRLTWWYFVLLVFEGSLRKWFFPEFSAELLFVRDPIVIGIYFLAARAGLWPRNMICVCLYILAGLCFVAGIAALPDHFGVVAYGFRSDFLHLPLIYILPKVLDEKDLRRLCRATLIISIPMALLMVAQYSSPSGSWINAGAGIEGGGQIGSAFGHIRPAGTFSFIVGPTCYFPLVAAILCESLVTGKRNYPRWLIVGSILGLVAACVVSGSRSLVFMVLIVVFSVLVASVFIHPRYAFRSMRIVLALIGCGVVLAQTNVMQDAFLTLTSRVQGADASEGGVSGVFTKRILLNYSEPYYLLDKVPLFGIGLGRKTIPGAMMMGEDPFAGGGEEEHTRIVFESGPILGSLFLLLRACMCAAVFGTGVVAMRKGNLLAFTLAVLSAINFMQAELGQTTELGFCVSLAALAYATATVQERGLSPKQSTPSKSFLPLNTIELQKASQQ
jgi:hypothetical protein